jgi:hypothetical protein
MTTATKCWITANRQLHLRFCASWRSEMLLPSLIGFPCGSQACLERHLGLQTRRRHRDLFRTGLMSLACIESLLALFWNSTRSPMTRRPYRTALIRQISYNSASPTASEIALSSPKTGRDPSRKAIALLLNAVQFPAELM